METQQEVSNNPYLQKVSFNLSIIFKYILLKHLNLLRDVLNSDLFFTSTFTDTNMALDFFRDTFVAIVDVHAPFERMRIKDKNTSWFTP